MDQGETMGVGSLVEARLPLYLSGFYKAEPSYDIKRLF